MILQPIDPGRRGGSSRGAMAPCQGSRSPLKGVFSVSTGSLNEYDKICHPYDRWPQELLDFALRRADSSIKPKIFLHKDRKVSNYLNKSPIFVYISFNKTPKFSSIVAKEIFLQHPFGNLSPLLGLLSPPPPPGWANSGATPAWSTVYTGYVLSLIHIVTVHN